MKQDKCILSLDTSGSKKILVGIRMSGVKYTENYPLIKNRAQALLPLVSQVLDRYQLSTANISAIEVNTGPGSFTGLKVGVAIAQALGFLLKIPVNGHKHDQIDIVYT